MPIGAWLPVEAHQLFAKLCAEAGAQGSMLGALKYLHRHVQALADQLGSQVARLEEAEFAKQELERVARRAVEAE